MESGLTKGFSAWLTAVTLQRETTFDSPTFQTALSLSLLLPITGTHSSGKCAKCGTPWDPHCSHFHSCTHRNKHIPHNALRDTFVSIAKRAVPHSVVATDQPGLGHSRLWSAVSSKRPDVLLLHQSHIGGHLLGDFYCPAFSSHPTWCRSLEVFWEKAEAKKKAEYNVPLPHQPLPLVVDQFGALGPIWDLSGTYPPQPAPIV